MIRLRAFFRRRRVRQARKLHEQRRMERELRRDIDLDRSRMQHDATRGFDLGGGF